MSSLTRWDPIREATTLRDAMSQLFEQAVMRPGFGAWAGGLVGQMNVLESDGHYLCQVILPGVNPNEIELTVRQNVLTVKASMPELLPQDVLKTSTFLLHEFGSGEFSRSVALPKDVDGDHVEAHYEQGILTIEVPVAQHAQPKRISVKAAEGTTQATTKVVEEKANAHQPAQVS